MYELGTTPIEYRPLKTSRLHYIDQLRCALVCIYFRIFAPIIHIGYMVMDNTFL